MEFDVDVRGLRGQLDALTAAVNPVPRLDSALRRGTRLRRRRRARLAVCSLLVVAIVGTVASWAPAGGGGDSSQIDALALPSTRINPPGSRDCHNADFSVEVPSRWYTNQAAPGVNACVAFTTVVGDPTTLIDNLFFPWSELQPPFDEPAIIFRRESNLDDEVVIADIIERDTGIRPRFNDSEFRSFFVPNGVVFGADRIEGADRAWQFTVRTNNATDGTPNGVIREYRVASNRNRLIWARFDPSKDFGDFGQGSVMFDELIGSLRLAA
jgi:hypothetical protein